MLEANKVRLAIAYELGVYCTEVKVTPIVVSTYAPVISHYNVELHLNTRASANLIQELLSVILDVDANDEIFDITLHVSTPHDRLAGLTLFA